MDQPSHKATAGKAVSETFFRLADSEIESFFFDKNNDCTLLLEQGNYDLFYVKKGKPVHKSMEQAIKAYKTELAKYKSSMDKVPENYDWSEGCDMAGAELIECNTQLDGWESALGLTRKEITSIYREVGIVRSKDFPPRKSKCQRKTLR